MDYHKIITIEPDKRSGKPCIRDTRMTVTDVLEYLAGGMSENDFTIVSKDSDFQQRSLLFGHPPKFIWLRVGNCPVETIEELLRKHSISIHTFSLDETKSHLLLP